MSRYYPVLLDVGGRPCLVIGGGEVAEAKARGLLACGARVTLIAPAVTSGLRNLAAAGRIHWVQRDYRPGDLEGFMLAIAATDSPAVNRRVWQEAEERRIWLNAVDDPDHCSFILPAVHRQGDLVLAVSTGGKSPALAARLRDRLAARLGPEYARWLELLGRLRPEVTRRVPDPDARKALWYRIVDSDALDRLRAGDAAGALATVRALIEGWAQVAAEEAVGSAEAAGTAGSP